MDSPLYRLYIMFLKNEMYWRKYKIEPSVIYEGRFCIKVTLDGIVYIITEFDGKAAIECDGDVVYIPATGNWIDTINYAMRK